MSCNPLTGTPEGIFVIILINDFVGALTSDAVAASIVGIQHYPTLPHLASIECLTVL